ncbi:MAG: hypothetical protein Q4F21_00770 [Lachnospiraceae bacterium]|nr:hypothetical protein [Lachnospiraceae bacterium]
MKNKMKNGRKILFLVLVLVVGLNSTAYAANDVESGSKEVDSLVVNENSSISVEDSIQSVDGIYNVDGKARASMTGVINLSQAGGKLVGNYSTTYTKVVDRIGVKNIKLQYQGALKIWYTIITVGDKYTTNDSGYMGAFTCDGVFGRTYRMSATHYIKNDSYTETRNNITEGLTFR